MTITVEQIASTHFRRVRADGVVIAEWHQEDEDAATSKAEAVGMIQRTVDFWMGHMIYEMQKGGIPLEEATANVTRIFRTNLLKTITSPFPRRWGITIDDFTFEVSS